MDSPVHPAHVGHFLVRALERQRETEVLELGDDVLTGKDLLDRVSQFDQALGGLGIGLGSTISILSRNQPEVLMVMGAGWVRGRTRMPLHPMDSVDDQAFCLQDSGATALIVDQSFVQRAAELAERVPQVEHILTFGPAAFGTDLIALADQYRPQPLEVGDWHEEHPLGFTYTGGTTGTPKGVPAPSRAIAELTKIQLSEWEWSDRPRLLLCTPLSHAGQAFFLPVIAKGGTLVVLDAFDAGRVLQTIEDKRINSLMLVPSMIYALLDHPDSHTRDLSSLETIYYGASAMSPTRLAEAIERFGPVFAQFYGQTEAPMAVTYFSKADHLVPAGHARLASCGRPSMFLRAELCGDDGRVVPVGEPGEIRVAGALLAAGYLNRPEESRAVFRDDGWMYTGDIAREDEDGFWYIVDRSKDMIVTGGFNVFPREVEDVIGQDPRVAQVSVIGTPDSRWGEAVTALVVLRDDAVLDETLKASVVARVREAKGPVHVPKKVFQIDSVPLTGLGKPDKKALRSRTWPDA